jgi:hypothetical protein
VKTTDRPRPCPCPLYLYTGNALCLLLGGRDKCAQDKMVALRITLTTFPWSEDVRLEYPAGPVGANYEAVLIGTWLQAVFATVLQGYTYLTGHMIQLKTKGHMDRSRSTCSELTVG